MKLFRLVFSVLLPALLLSVSALELSASRAPQHVVFTYAGDPSTTLTVNWQSLVEAPTTTKTEVAGEAEVYYDTVSHNGVIEDFARHSHGVATQIEGLDDRFTYRAHLTDLQPNTTYYLVVGNSVTGFSTELKVKTIAKDDSALRFVTGGDMGTSEDTKTLLRHAASYSPGFAVIGGDIAYANGNLRSVGNWDIWLKYYTDEMVTPEGYSIPIVLAVGNHELRGGFHQSNSHAPFYFGFFGQDPERSYFVRQFGQNLVLYVLDSGHAATHESQVEWMHSQFNAHAGIKYQAAVYHVPLYPSHRDFTGAYSAAGREHWGPVFDTHNLTVAFENHDHTFKRTHLLKGGEATKDASGTLYLGDGCWGRDVRSIDYEPRWYLDATASLQHFWVVDMDSEQAVYRAVDIENRVFDVYPQTEVGAKSAAKLLASAEQVYAMPKGTIHVDGYHNVEEQWLGGATTVTLRNSFDFPISAQLQLTYPQDQLTAEGLPEERIQLSAGATQSFSVAFILKPGVSIARDSLKRKLRLRASFELDDPTRDEVVHVNQTLSISLRPAKVSKAEHSH